MSNGTKAIGAVGVAAAAAVGVRGGETFIIADSGNAALHGSTAGTRAFDFSTSPVLLPRVTIDEIPQLTLDRIPSITTDDIPQLKLNVRPQLSQDVEAAIVGTSDSYLTDNVIDGGTTTLRKMNQRSITAAIQDDVISKNSHKTPRKLSSLFKLAEPQILNDLGANAGRLTTSEIKKIVSDELTKTVAKAASQPRSGITFEVLTGKLTIDSSRTVFGITLTAGEVNVYKVSATLAAGIVACEALAAPELKKCAKAALAKVGSAVAQELKLEPTNSSKESSDK